MGKRSETDSRIIVRKLPHSETTDEGRFYAMVDGRKVGERGRMFWHSKPDALRCGVRFLTAVLKKERTMRNRMRLSNAHREIEARKSEVCESCPTLLDDDQKRFCRPCGDYWDDVSKGLFDEDRNR